MTSCPTASSERGVLTCDPTGQAALDGPSPEAASGPDAEIGPEQYRATFRRFAAGVAVITADAGAGPVGFTATSLASVSLAPPLVSFAVTNGGSSWQAIAATETVVINILDAGQERIAQRFAAPAVDRFASPTRWSRLPTGEPILDDAPSHLVGRIEHRYPAGDHRLVVARVVAASTRPFAPLVYHAGRYQSVSGH
jgi:flavin reductase (DIM6/NTAB) family NADH-FMN oxidoreductase RutF